MDIWNQCFCIFKNSEYQNYKFFCPKYFRKKAYSETGNNLSLNRLLSKLESFLAQNTEAHAKLHHLEA